MSRTQRTLGKNSRGHLKDGLRPPEHAIWKMMIQKCENTSSAEFKNYGARGIRVCDRWLGDEAFTTFLADVGRQPFASAGLRLIDRQGNFEPGNVEWANTRSGRILTFNGRSMPLIAWAEEIGIAAGTLRARLNNGWPIDKVLTRSVAPRFPYGTWPLVKKIREQMRANGMSDSR